MIVSLFGATGRTGQRLLAECLERGWVCRLLVRKPAALPGAGALFTATGDPRNDGDVGPTLEGAEAVFCTLGLSDITYPVTDFSDSVKAIVRGMKTRNIRRIIVVGSAVALDDPAGGYRASKSPSGTFRNINAEHIRNYETLRDSGLDWTFMCPLSLSEDIPVGHARLAYEDLPGGSSETGYADLARTMVNLVHDRTAFRKRVGIVSDR